MKFSAAAVAAALVAGARAASFTNLAFDVEQGKPFTLTWDGASGPVTISLANGPSTNLKVVKTLDEDDTGKSFTFTPSGLPTDTYAFEISDSSGVNYSLQFSYTGTGPATTSGTSKTSSASTSTSTGSITTKISNSTITTTSVTSTSSSTTTSSSSSPTTTTSTTPFRPTNPNDSPKYQSPLALVLVTVASLIYFS